MFSVPAGESATVMPFALSSPRGKLSVEELGMSPVGPTNRNPGAVWFVTVKFAVIATAPAGTLPFPVIWYPYDAPARIAPAGPTAPGRVSMMRVGGSGLYLPVWLTNGVGGGVGVAVPVITESVDRLGTETMER